jgi:hypothetical protein
VSPDLLSDDGRDRASAWEELVLRALGLDRLEADVDALALAYRRLSDALAR